VNVLRIISQLRFCLIKPETVQILIYDRVGSQFIVRALRKNLSFKILDVRNNKINLHPRVLLSFVQLLFRRTKNSNKYWGSTGLRVLIELSEIMASHPKVVLSFVDNGRRFNLLSRIYREATFIGIQNGFRGIEVADMANYLCLTNLFCFGEETIYRYRSEACGVSRFIVGGSLKNGLYMESRPNILQKSYDICWVSQYRPARFEETMPELRENSLQLLKYVQRYCSESGKTLAIACSCKERAFPYEYRFLLQVLDDVNGTTIVPNDDNNFSSYKLIDQSRVTVTVNSTIGLEALSRGNKVLFCNFSKDKYYDIPSGYTIGPWSLTDHDVDYTKFRDKLEQVFNSSDAEWQEQTLEMAQYFVRSDDTHLPQDLLREEIDRVLSISNEIVPFK